MRASASWLAMVSACALCACAGKKVDGAPDAGQKVKPPPVTAKVYDRTAGDNPIVTENQKPGDGDWYIQKEANNREIEGYASDVSVEAGETLNVMVSTSVASDYTYAVYRLGWYGGQGARKVLTGPTLHGTPGDACPADAQTELVECHWPASFSISIPGDWVSGAYLVKLHRADGYERYVPFIVRDHRAAEVLFKAAVDTDEAYNRWGGESLYYDSSHRSPSGMGFKVSFDRPFDDGAGMYSMLWWEQHAIRWLERGGYDVTYGTNVDAARFDGFYKGIGAIVTAGHDEYWSQRERDVLDDVLASGDTSIVNLTANAGYWRIRYEADADGTPFRRMVCYKAKQSLDPDIDAGSTARFRDAPDAQPENAVFGDMYEDWLFTGFPLVIGDVSDPLFAGTGFKPGDTVPGLVGYEYDRSFDNGASPPGLVVLADSPVLNAEAFPSSSQVVKYTTAKGRLVFTSGSIYWALALSDDSSRIDTRIWKLTWNVMETALAHRRSPRPFPSDWPITVRTDGATVPRFASTIAAVAGSPGVHQVKDGPVSSASFEAPTGIAVAADGTIYVSDSSANVIRAIKNGQVTTFAGDGVDGSLDGPAAQARFRIPAGLAIGPDGALYVADSNNGAIRRIAMDSQHTVTTYAGDPNAGWGGFANGPGAQARFFMPVSLAFGQHGELYVADEENNLIRVIANDSQHTVSTFAGTWNGYADGPALQAAFNYPSGVALGPDGTLYILDAGNARIRCIKPSSSPVVETVAGSGTFGFADGPGNQAMIRGISGLLWMPSGLLFADTASNRIRQLLVDPQDGDVTVTTFAGTGLTGSALSTPDQTPIVAPAGLAVGPDGKVYVTDTGNALIRVLTP